MPWLHHNKTTSLTSYWKAWPKKKNHIKRLWCMGPTLQCQSMDLIQPQYSESSHSFWAVHVQVWSPAQWQSPFGPQAPSKATWIKRLWLWYRRQAIVFYLTFSAGRLRMSIRNRRDCHLRLASFPYMEIRAESVNAIRAWGTLNRKAHEVDFEENNVPLCYTHTPNIRGDYYFYL